MIFYFLIDKDLEQSHVCLHVDGEPTLQLYRAAAKLNERFSYLSVYR